MSTFRFGKLAVACTHRWRATSLLETIHSGIFVWNKSCKWMETG